MTNFYQQYKAIKPYLQTDSKPADGREHLQTVADRKKLVRPFFFFFATSQRFFFC